MNPMINHVVAAIEQRFLRFEREAVGTAVNATMGPLLASFCAAAGLACFVAGFWIFLLPHVGPVGAPVIVGGVLFLVSLGILAARRLAVRVPPPPAEIPQALSLADATALLKDQKAPVLFAALLAGLAAGRAEK